MKPLVFLLLALTARASVRLEWDADTSPDTYFRIKANAETYLSSEPSITIDILPGRYVFRVFAVSSSTGLESLPLESPSYVLMEIEQSDNLLNWRKAGEVLYLSAEDRKFWRLRINP